MAQDVPTEVKYNLRGLTYPRVAHLARIQGIVQLGLIPNESGQEIRLLSGNKWFEREATDNLAKWHTNQRVTVKYIFRLTDPTIVKIRVPRGDAFDRFWLRIFRRATYTEEPRSGCTQKISTSGPRAVQQSPMILEVEVTATVLCVQTETSPVASR